jgi:hypothetical protein
MKRVHRKYLCIHVQASLTDKLQCRNVDRYPTKVSLRGVQLFAKILLAAKAIAECRGVVPMPFYFPCFGILSLKTVGS